MSHYGIRAVDRPCGPHVPGHLMHWIQAKKSHEDGQPIIKVKVVAVHDDRRAEIERHDLKLTLWYHDLDHLRSALCLGGRAEWRPKYYVLYVISGGSFNLATLDQVVPCKPPIRRRPAETTRQFIKRAMRENHGYTVPARWLADLDADNPFPGVCDCSLMCSPSIRPGSSTRTTSLTFAAATSPRARWSRRARAHGPACGPAPDARWRPGWWSGSH